MKVSAISRILDEADIIESFVRHTAHYVDNHIILDNGSTDGTIEILRALKNEGIPLTVYQNLAVSFSEQSFMTFMYYRAVEDHSSDWVICLDGDEFIDDRHLPGGLIKTLENVTQDIPAVKIPWHHYQYTQSDDESEVVAPLRMVKRLPSADACKVIVRGKSINNKVVIDNGGHDVLIDGNYNNKLPVLPDTYLAHYSERNVFQYIVKFMRGWAKIRASDQETRSRGVSIHYRGPYEIIRDRPHELLRNSWFMTGKNEGKELVIDPIDYKGGPLRHTEKVDAAMLAVRSLSGYMEALADRHAVLLDTIPSVKDFVEISNQQHSKIL